MVRVANGRATGRTKPSIPLAIKLMEITRMSSKIGNTLSVAIGAAVIGTLSLSQLAAASPVFQASDLASGYMLAAAPEGKCGEGKCGVAKMDTNKDGKVEMTEAVAGGFSETQVKAWDKNGDGSLEENELKAMHAVMDNSGAMKKKGAEGSCGGDKGDKKKGAEGSCGGSI
jgi:uncharacterized low-complexity protein